MPRGKPDKPTSESRVYIMGKPSTIIYLVGGLEHQFYCPRNIGLLSSSQLTNSNLFQDGVAKKPPTRYTYGPYSTAMLNHRRVFVPPSWPDDRPFPTCWTDCQDQSGPKNTAETFLSMEYKPYLGKNWKLSMEYKPYLWFIGKKNWINLELLPFLSIRIWCFCPDLAHLTIARHHESDLTVRSNSFQWPSYESSAFYPSLIEGRHQIGPSIPLLVGGLVAIFCIFPEILGC